MPVTMLYFLAMAVMSIATDGEIGVEGNSLGYVCLLFDLLLVIALIKYIFGGK